MTVVQLPLPLLSLLLLHLLVPRAAGCGRRPARVQLPPPQYLRPFVIRKVPCDQHEQLFCANGGRCTVPVKWSVLHGRIEERLDGPSCECASGYTGYNCDIPELPSVHDLNTAVVSVVLFVALLVLLLLAVAYLCCASRTSRRRPRARQQLTADDVGDGVPLATVAMATSTKAMVIVAALPSDEMLAYDRASVRDFIDEEEECSSQKDSWDRE